MTKQWLALLCLAGLILACTSVDAGNVGSTPFDALDGVPESAYRVDLTAFLSADYESAASGSIVELDVDWELAYYQPTEQSVLDVRVAARLTLLSGTGDLDLPSLLLRAALDAGWTWDCAPDYTLAVRAYQGLYTDVSGLSLESLAVPLAVAIERSLHPQLSIIGGFDYRHSFQDAVTLILGADWKINEGSRLRIGIPESRYDLFLSREWSAALGLQWENTSYYMNDTTDLITVDDLRWFVGVTRRLSDQLELDIRVGGLLDRTLEFENPNSQGIRDVEISGGTFLSVGVRGPF